MCTIRQSTWWQKSLNLVIQTRSSAVMSVLNAAAAAAWEEQREGERDPCLIAAAAVAISFIESSRGVQLAKVPRNLAGGRIYT